MFFGQGMKNERVEGVILDTRENNVNHVSSNIDVRSPKDVQGPQLEQKPPIYRIYLTLMTIAYVGVEQNSHNLCSPF